MTSLSFFKTIANGNAVQKNNSTLKIVLYEDLNKAKNIKKKVVCI